MKKSQNSPKQPDSTVPFEEAIEAFEETISELTAEQLEAAIEKELQNRSLHEEKAIAKIPDLPEEPETRELDLNALEDILSEEFQSSRNESQSAISEIIYISPEELEAAISNEIGETPKEENKHGSVSEIMSIPVDLLENEIEREIHKAEQKLPALEEMDEEELKSKGKVLTPLNAPPPPERMAPPKVDTEENRLERLQNTLEKIETDALKKLKSTAQTKKGWGELQSILEEVDRSILQNLPQSSQEQLQPSTLGKAQALPEVQKAPQFLQHNVRFIPPKRGDLIEDYCIIRKIGEGGIRVVYKGEKKGGEKKKVSIKIFQGVLSKDDPKVTQQFQEETQKLLNLKHPRIIKTLTVGEAPTKGYIYFVMDSVEGKTLEEVVDATNRLLPKTAAKYLKDALRGLKHAHENKIIHQDIKPANILISKTGNAFLTNFGLTNILEGSKGTQQGGIIGTPFYLSPERIESLEGDERSDVYSLGMVLYNALTGVLPFRKKSIVEILNAQRYEEPTPIQDLSPECPQGLVDIFQKATRKKPEERFQTAQEFLVALEKLYPDEKPKTQRIKGRSRTKAASKKSSDKILQKFFKFGK